MNLQELHHTEIKNISWFPPNLMREWNAAKQYPEYFSDRTSWLNHARGGEVITIHPNVKIKIANLSDKGSYDKIVSEKRSRVEKAFEDGRVEMPIMFHNKEGEYELVCGNARLVYAMDHEIPAKVLVLPAPKNNKKDKDKKDDNDEQGVHRD
jgi:hypothetical protein